MHERDKISDDILLFGINSTKNRTVQMEVYQFSKILFLTESLLTPLVRCINFENFVTFLLEYTRTISYQNIKLTINLITLN